VAERRPPQPPLPAPDDWGVRVVPKPDGPWRLRPWAVVAVIALVVTVACFVLAPQPGADAKAAPIAVDGEASAAAEARRPQSARAPTTASIEEPPAMPSNDPDDLAAYFRPGDPEPTGAEVIGALHEAGVRTGLGAFNPPGTSPPLEGLAVPADFKLPEGYVRHHQVTDEGVPIEPILMFSPDFTLYDPQGRPIAMPPDRVVPPDLAPPGLPLRRVRVGSP
jgi:hypothetical protein